MIWRLWYWNKMCSNWVRTSRTKTEGTVGQTNTLLAHQECYWLPASLTPIGRKVEDFADYKSIPGVWEAGSGKERPQ